MKDDKGIWVRVCIRAAGVFLLLGIFTRIWAHYNDIHPAKLEPFFGLTAEAMLRMTDTFLLFAIAIGVYQIVSSKDKDK
jgi:hypothetical protein